MAADHGGGRMIGRQPRFAALALIAMLCAARLPAILKVRGGQDEDHFAVPGTTILQAGVPRIPYCPARDRDSPFFEVDRLLHALPPGFFYWQAAVQGVLGPGYWSGRIAALLAGAVLLQLVFAFAGNQGGPAAGLFAVALLGLSRPWMFQAQLARPDMLCAALCYAAIMLAERSGGRRPALIGFMLGLAALTHPFALAAGIALAASTVGAGLRACWGTSPASRPHRLAETGGGSGLPVRLAWLAAGAGAALLLWLPLILADPALWWTQFRGNVLGRASAGLFGRLLEPRDMLAAQGRNLVEHFGWPLLGMFAVGMPLALRDPRSRRLACWALGVFATLWWLLGTHPAKGYWVLPAALACSALGVCLSQPSKARGGWPWRLLLGVVALACCLPGGGWSTAWNHVRHWHDPQFDHRRTIAAALADLPAEATLLADQGCVLDCWLAGRKVTLALDRPGFFDSRGTKSHYLVLTAAAADLGLAPEEFGFRRLLDSYGRRDDADAAQVEVWAP